MKNLKKTLALALAGVMMAAAAVAFTGCFGMGGNGGNGGSSSSDSKEGTWVLVYATDYYGTAYDLPQSLMDSVYLVIDKGAKKGTFYYMDDDPYPGTLERYAERDDYYASDGYKAQAYKLKGDDGYWEFAWITDLDTNGSFWYLEVGRDTPDSLFLEKK